MAAETSSSMPGESGKALAPPPKDLHAAAKTWTDILESLGWIVANVVSSLACVLCNKSVLQTHGFHYIATLNVLHYLATVIMLEFLAAIGGHDKGAMPMKERVKVGSMSVVSVQLQNTSLLVNSVGFYQIFKLLVIPSSMVLESLTTGIDRKYDFKPEEVEVKTRKLKKLFTKYSEIKAEIVDIQEEFQKDREDMLDTIRSLQQQLKLKQAMIDHFVPPEESKKIGSKAQWDDEHECWLLERLSDDLDENEVPNNKGVPVSKRPQSAGGRRPTTDYARIANAMGDQNPRFRAENIIQLELDLPERTTYDYNGGSQEQQHLSNVMFQGDEEEFFN